MRDAFADCETHFVFNVRDPEKRLKSVCNNSVRFSRNTQSCEEFRAWIRVEVD